MTENTPPSKRERITKPLGLESPGFTGRYAPDGTRYGPDQGREYMIDRLVNVHGWSRPNSQGAEAWVDQLLERYPAIAHGQLTMAVDIVDILARTVHDPHDWDSVGSVLDLLDYIGREVL